MKNRVQFILAVLVAATYEVWTGILKPFLELARDTLKKIVHSQHSSNVFDIQRMEHCRRCPLFYRPLATCGSPLMKDKDLGCHCHMPTKVKTQCNCWLYDETEGKQGWPRYLNDFKL